MSSLEGYRSLADDEFVEADDVVKDLAAGEFRVVSDDTVDGLMIGLRARSVRQWEYVNDVLRKEPTA